jgi:hypothetical protein
MCESPAIGPSIMKVILSALRIQPDGAGRWSERLPVIESRGVDTGIDIREDLEAAFAILKSYGNSITIGISDEFGDDNWDLLGYTQKMDST